MEADSPRMQRMSYTGDTRRNKPSSRRSWPALPRGNVTQLRRGTALPYSARRTTRTRNAEGQSNW
ncbi:hypothetical protein GDO81_020456 [Engystomops pustulosus]|uniref:Uncharacterized protein n=1 Tax=Engystomops pustulosus TaxID=76066 RepID=A0AAV6Z840_ENGPU|nr:hypothetical protein GDO81_020456 [Engystomops pustulosus]